MQKLHKGIHNTTRQLSRAITLQRMNFEQTLPTYTTEKDTRVLTAYLTWLAA